MATAEPIATLTDVNAEHECLSSLSNTAQELIKFRLYDDTEGVWVCCDICDKWRYVANQRDPAFFFKRNFHCRDVKKKCNVGTEKGSDQTFYETSFCAGSLVWAKRPNGHKQKDWPWWPALVEDSPDAVSQYFLLDASGSHPIAYHVTYLDAYRTSGWVASSLIKPFDSETKGVISRATSRVGKKQRILKEALERAKNAAEFDVRDRLENFSYIAHMARMKGLIKASKQPVDTILNGTQQASERRVSPGLAEEVINAPTVKKGRGRPRKRKLETTESEVVTQKMAKTSAEQASPLTRVETAERQEIKVPQTKNELKIDVDSGYAVDEESPIEKSVPMAGNQAPAKTTEKPKDQSDSLNMSENSISVDLDQSPSSRGADNEPKKREPLRSVKTRKTKPKPAENVKTAITKKTKKNDEQEPQTTASEQIEAPKAKPSSRRKKSPPKDSAVESLAEESVSDPSNRVSDSVPDAADLEVASIIQDSGPASSGFETQSASFEPSVPEVPVEKAVFNSEPDTLESTSNLKVVRKRRPKAQEATIDENEPPKPASFSTQGVRKEKSTRTLGLSKRPGSAASVKPAAEFSMSQPLPSRSRGKFAPPTRPKPEDGDYTFDDFRRDLDDGVI